MSWLCISGSEEKNRGGYKNSDKILRICPHIEDTYHWRDVQLERATWRAYSKFVTPQRVPIPKKISSRTHMPKLVIGSSFKNIAELCKDGRQFQENIHRQCEMMACPPSRPLLCSPIFARYTRRWAPSRAVLLQKQWRQQGRACWSQLTL